MQTYTTGLDIASEFHSTAQAGPPPGPPPGTPCQEQRTNTELQSEGQGTQETDKRKEQNQPVESSAPTLSA